ncbi:hypothetical protein LXL04_020920 [Taraxacum kok-saghyz]
MLDFNEEARSPFVKKFKTIIHPGEVSRIRELPQNSKIVATHTDSPDVLIWDVEAQPNRHAVLGATESRPDLILTGLQEKAEFALAMCQSEPFVLSGGKGKSVVLWSIHDHISSLATESPGSNGPKTENKVTDSPKIQAMGSIKAIQILLKMYSFAPLVRKSFVVLVMTRVLFYGMREPDLLQLLRTEGKFVKKIKCLVGERFGLASKLAPGLLFRHSGHRYIFNFNQQFSRNKKLIYYMALLKVNDMTYTLNMKSKHHELILLMDRMPTDMNMTYRGIIV